MQSKTSYFSTVVKKNLTRFWPLWGIATFFWLLIPFAFLMNYTGESYNSADGAEWYYGGATGFLPIFLLIYSCFVAMAVWSYMYTGKSVGLMHSLPITRNGLFAASFVSGLIMVITPVAAAGIVLGLFQIFSGGFPALAFLLTVVITVAESAFFFAFATFIAHLTGNILALPILYFILNFLAVIIEYVISIYASILCYGLRDVFSGNLSFLSPVVHLLMHVEYVDRYTYEMRESGAGFSSKYQYVEGWDSIGIYALLAVVLILAALFLYRKRKSETAGEVVSAKILRPVALYCFTTCATLAGGLVLFAIFSGFDPGNNVPLLALCMIISAFIGYYGGLMIIKRKLRVFDKKSLPGIIVVCVASIFMIALLRADAFGREKYIPEQDRVDYVVAWVEGVSFKIPVDEAHKGCFEEVRNLHRRCIEEKSLMIERERRLYANPASSNSTSSVYAQFDYYLKNGKRVSRKYTIWCENLGRNAAPGSIEEFLADFMRNKELQLQSVYADSGLIPEYVYLGYEDLSPSDAVGIYKAVIEDIKDGNYSFVISGEFDYDYEWALDFSMTLSKERPDSPRGIYEEYGDWVNINIHLTPGMKHTVEYLESRGVDFSKYAGSYVYY